MDTNIIADLHLNFERAANSENGVTYWFARDLQGFLEYAQWRRFEDVIEKAKIACANSNQPVENHFAEVGKMVDLGSDSSREIMDVRAVLAKSDIRPEDLPPEMDIKKLDRQVKSQDKKMPSTNDTLNEIKDKIEE